MDILLPGMSNVFFLSPQKLLDSGSIVAEGVDNIRETLQTYNTKSRQMHVSN